MCGIAGLWFAPTAPDSELRDRIDAMNASIIHRGPDDGGVWVDATSGIALGNRRLAILDLSLAGHQPMISACQRYVLVYNGETYNFESIREELRQANRPCQSGSDTEVILEGCAVWGVRATVERMNGIFAFALWDRRDRTLTLGRDRLGIKPLYYGWCADRRLFLFGSELKALTAHPDFKPEIDRDSLTLFLRTGYIPAPYSIYRGIHKLPPGCLLELEDSASSARVTPYWQAKAIAEQGMRLPFTGDESDAVGELDRLLQDAIRLQTIADVPVGAFLSGGIDSTAVVAIMQSQARSAVKTFSIGFADPAYDEARHARDIAQYLHTDHTEMYVTPAQAQEVIPRLPDIYDEPFADSSQIPTFLVSKLTRGTVTVSLSGDGGDELFAGYSHYRSFQRQWMAMQRVPELLRGAAGMVVAPVLRSRLGVRPGLGAARTGAPSWVRQSAQYLRTAAEILNASHPEALYGYRISQWKTPSEVVIGGSEPARPFTRVEPLNTSRDVLDRIMYLDQVSYLPDDILAKVDRASMAVSLEARVPLLDHRVVEFSWRLPFSLKMREGQGKWVLRQVLNRYMPAKLVDRPKRGFCVPVGDWLRGPLRPWAEQLLDERRLKQEGFFDPRAIRNAWQEHLSDQRTWTNALWSILMFQAWHERWRGRTSA